MLFASLLASATLASAVSISEFTKSPVRWVSPEGRGFSASSAANAPCGGVAMGSRTKFPLTGGEISLTQSANIDNLNVLYYKGDNPERFHQFASYTNTVSDLSSGHYCTPAPDFTSLGFSAGDSATLLLIYAFDGQDTMYYQCADVELVATSNYVKASYMCGNYTTELNVASSDDSLKLTTIDTTSGSSSGSSVHSSNVKAEGLTAAQGGGIGAGAAAGFFLILIGALYAIGRVHFGKRLAPVSLDDASSTSSVMKQRV